MNAILALAIGTLFGVFELPPGTDPNAIVGELLSVMSVRVGDTNEVCVQGADPDGVEFVPVFLPPGMVLESIVEDPNVRIVRYSWTLDTNDIGIHYVILGFVDQHPIDPMMTEGTIVIEVLPPSNVGGPVMTLCEPVAKLESLNVFASVWLRD